MGFEMRKAEFILLIGFFALAIGISAAQIPENARLTGTNLAAIVVVDEVGGPLNGSNNKAVITGDSIFGFANSSSTRICIGYICVEFGPAGELLSITFLLDLNISGPAGDIAFVDTQGIGLYRPKDISRSFVCVEDPTATGKPVLGIIHAGSSNLKYIRLDTGSSFILRLAQQQPGNKFIVPVTSGGCDIIRNKFPLVLPLSPFALPANLLNTIELIITYPFDLKGDFEKTGAFTLVLEKNESQIAGGVK